MIRTPRLEAVFGTGVEGRALIVGAAGNEDFPGFLRNNTLIVENMAQHFEALGNAGWQVSNSPEGSFNTVLVTLPRARDAARARLHEAAQQMAPGGSLWVDGQKSDGIEGILREIKTFSGVSDVYSKAHGKIARIDDPAAIPAGWARQTLRPTAGFSAAAGMFSPTGIDAGSAALAEALPDRLPTRIVDLGAGWGWLSAQILTHPGVQLLHLVEADHSALAAARDNISDPRAVFHWADARGFSLPDPVNGVIMNPPFHEGRAADPALGAAFIATAARLMTGSGRLWMVANRHLPYEAELARHFGQISEIGGDGRFKILTATGAKGRKK